MKYMVHWKIENKDLDEVIDKFMESSKRSDPEKYPKTIFMSSFFLLCIGTFLNKFLLFINFGHISEKLVILKKN